MLLQHSKWPPFYKIAGTETRPKPLRQVNNTYISKNNRGFAIFIPCPTKWGRGVLSSPRMSDRWSVPRPHFVSGAEPYNPCMNFFNFGHTHPGGVDVPFGLFEILPTYLVGHNGQLNIDIWRTVPDR